MKPALKVTDARNRPRDIPPSLASIEIQTGMPLMEVWPGEDDTATNVHLRVADTIDNVISVSLEFQDGSWLVFSGHPVRFTYNAPETSNDEENREENDDCAGD